MPNPSADPARPSKRPTVSYRTRAISTLIARRKQDRDAAEPCILLIEEGMHPQSVQEYVRSRGYGVIRANSAKQAREVLMNSRARIEIVLAIAKPLGACGFALARWIKAMRPGVQVILGAVDTPQWISERPHRRNPRRTMLRQLPLGEPARPSATSP